jgi:peptide/nickel transport system substrate-binding protein
MSDYHLGIFSAGTTDFDKGIGSGGYILENFETGVRSITKRNPNYWKKGRAHFDEVECISIADINARLTALKTSSIDYMNRVDTKIADLLKRDSNLRLIDVTGTYHNSMPMLTDVAPYNDNNVRMALKHSIDRKALVKTILRGYGALGNDHPIGPNQKYFASELPQRQYDPDKAKHYLKKSGITDDVFKLHAAEGVFSGSLDTAVLYQEHAANPKQQKKGFDSLWSV